ncbi:hypothetical protein Tco_1236127 [Tanacetum coccineum]
MGENVYIWDLIDFDVTISTSRGKFVSPKKCLVWFVKYYANMRRTVVDFSHAPPNEYSPSPNDKKQWDVGLGGSRFRNFAKKESMKKAFQDMLHGLGGNEENSEDNFSCGSALEDYITLLFVLVRNIKKLFARYLKEHKHPKHEAKLRSHISKLKWQTAKNHVDYRVFVMLHMESYIGDPIAKWDVGLCEESKEQVSLLSQSIGSGDTNIRQLRGFFEEEADEGKDGRLRKEVFTEYYMKLGSFHNVYGDPPKEYSEKDINEECKKLFARYLKEHKHPKHEAKLRSHISKLKWQIAKNHVDYMVFMMLHMESYIGDPIAKWDVGLCEESEEQVSLLRRMRFKISTKILLHKFNVHAENMFDLAYKRMVVCCEW